jgi:hypothetical protein
MPFVPLLYVLSLHGSPLWPCKLPLQWSQLTDLDLESVNLPDIPKLLTLRSNLETYAVTVGAFSSMTISQFSDSRPEIALPKLQILKV